MIKIAPSLLAADFTALGEQCRTVLSAGADMLHFDVMDGHFVPNISIGLPVLQSLKNNIDAVYDVHLMIENPDKYISEFRKAGADIITVHLEACENAQVVLKQIRQSGAKAGLSIKPDTSAESIFTLLPFCDLVLVMSVEPGFGGQSFMHSALPKLEVLRKEIDKLNLNIMLEVDGGINSETASLCIKAGADVLVAGSAVFTAANPAMAVSSLRRE